MKTGDHVTWIGLALLAAVSAAGCSKNGSPTAPTSGCEAGLVFSVLPIPVGAIASATPLGNMGPPGHTIPTDHVGFYLNGTGVTLVSPSSFRITSVTQTHYLSSPFRNGQSDYAVKGSVCAGHELLLGHLQSLVGKIQTAATGNCSTYSTADETVQQCRNDSVDVSMAAGETIGTVGGASAGAFDFGLYQPGHQNFFVNPSRYSSQTLQAVCPYDPFTPDLRNQINALIGQPGVRASGESPICGSMSVDVAGTARGVWVLQSSPVNQAGDETNFVALAPYPFAPQSSQTLSLGPAAIAGSGGVLIPYPTTTTGRVNRQFQDVTADGQIYCYNYNQPFITYSHFIRLDGSVLSIQKVTHPSLASPCSADPSTWVMNGSALTFIR